MSLQPNTIPKDGFAGTGGGNKFVSVTTSTHNVATASFDVGTKVRYFNKDLAGFGTCIYLQINVTGSESTALIAGSPVGVDETVNKAYQVTSDQTAIGDGAPTAIALSGMTDEYFGWFWCGGVAPDFSTASGTKFSATTVVTDNSIAKGKGFQLALSTVDNLIVVATTSAVISKMGYALDDDGGTTTDMGNLHLYDKWG